MQIAALALIAVVQGATGSPPSQAGVVVPRDTGWVCSAPHEAQRKADMAVVSAGVRAGLADGEARLATYEAVLAHAPEAPWPAVEICGDTLLVHQDNPLAALMTGAALLPKLAPPAPRTSVASPMPYGYAALLVGSINDEAGRYARGLAALERGAALSPGNVALASERAFALGKLRRYPEALAVADAALAANPGLSPVLTAALQRKRGFALGEMSRYDEGIEAYRASLRLDPADAKPLNEIRYLEGRKAGRGPSPETQSTTAKDRNETGQSPPAAPASAGAPPQDS